jgi:cyclic pyranopterin phosphate synthase
MLIDSFGREINYIRLSVTDRCNLRCVYCVPETYTRFSPASEILSYEEIFRLISTFAELGVTSVRVTGGEPLVRQSIDKLINRLSQIDGISDIALSSNAVLLGRLVGRLKETGLNRVNISLDTLDPAKFSKITRNGRLENVMAGVNAAVSSQLFPVKLNVVVAKGMNEEEIGDFVKLTVDRPIHVRFIEIMPMGETDFFSADRWISLEEIMKRAQPLEPLQAEDWPPGYGPARYYRRPGAAGSVGFISALGHRSCSTCNRMRLTARGILFPCLDSSEGTDLKTALRSGATQEEIKGLIRQTVEKKPERHFMRERYNKLSTSPRYMCQIGG